MEETFSDKALHALVFLGICAAIIFIGWNEPLRYRFMNAQEIRSSEARSVEEQATRSREWVPSNNRLSEPPRYKSGGGGEIYALPYRKSDGLAPPPERRGSH